jgi:hypothetical protein
MHYGEITVRLVREPVVVGILVEGQQQSGPFVANRLHRGITLSDNAHALHLTMDEALAVLEWLQDRAPVLRAMVEEETAALDAIAAGHPGAGAPGRPSQAEGDRETIEADLGEQEANGGA